jgi:DNA-binding NtrC family response regulator
MGQAANACRRALVVEDDDCLSELGAMMLEEFGLAVDQVGTAEAALDHLRDSGGEIAVVLIDVHLPGRMDGIALARSVSVLWPSITVIVTSGDPAYRADGMPDRALYVPKPWRALDIVAIAEHAARQDHSVRSVRL